MTDTAGTGPEPKGDGDGKSPLDRKVGPLSLRAWLIVAPVGIGVGLLAARRLSRTPAATQGGDEGSDRPVAVDVPGGIGGGYPITPPTPGGTDGYTEPAPTGPPPPQGPPLDNLEWMRRASNYLIGRGYNSLDIDTALRLYIGSEPMTERHAALVGMALAALGPPPDYVSPVQVSTGAVPSPGDPATPAPQEPTPPPPPAPPAPVAPAAPAYEVGPGTTGSQRLRVIQFIFKASNHPNVQVTGNWDGETAAAARAYQRFFGRPETDGLSSYEVDAIQGMWAARQPQ